MSLSFGVCRTSELTFFSFLGPSLLLVSPTVSHSARELMWSLKAPRLSRAGRPRLLLTTETSLTRCTTCPGPRPPLTRRCWPPAPCPTWRPPGPGRSSTGSSAPSPSTPARTPSAWWRRTTASARKILSDTQTVITASRCIMCCPTSTHLGHHTFLTGRWPGVPCALPTA